jgi:hypothetical protein
MLRLVNGAVNAAYDAMEAWLAEDLYVFELGSVGLTFGSCKNSMLYVRVR